MNICPCLHHGQSLDQAGLPGQRVLVAEQLLEPFHLVLGIVGHQHRDLGQGVVHAVVEDVEEYRTHQGQVKSTLSFNKYI